MKCLLTLPTLALLCACSQTPPPQPVEPVIKTVEVKVPTPVPCAALAKLGPEPEYPDTDAAVKAAPDIFSATKLLTKGRLMRIQRLAAYGAAKVACSF